MDRRGFLKLGALLPFYKTVIKKLIENKAPEPIEEMTIDWRDSYAKSLADNYYGLNDPMFAPSRTRIGEFDVVGKFPHKIQLTTTDNEHWFSSDGGFTWINGTSEYEADAWREYWEKEARSAYLYEFPGLDKIVATGHGDDT